MKSGFVSLAGKIAGTDANQDVEVYNKLVGEYNTLGTKIDQAGAALRTAQMAYAFKVGMQIK